MYNHKKTKTTEDENFHFIAQYLTRQLIPPFSTIPSLLSKIITPPEFSSKGWMTDWTLEHTGCRSHPTHSAQTRSPVLSPGMAPPPPKCESRRWWATPRQAAYCCWPYWPIGRPVILPASHSTKGSSFAGQFYDLHFERRGTLHCSTLHTYLWEMGFLPD